MAVRYFQFAARSERLGQNDSRRVRERAVAVSSGPASSPGAAGPLVQRTWPAFCSLSRFGRGFTVKVHVKDARVSMEALTRFMQLHFPKTYLKVSGGRPAFFFF